jgi:hypothetical protein
MAGSEFRLLLPNPSGVPSSPSHPSKRASVSICPIPSGGLAVVKGAIRSSPSIS